MLAVELWASSFESDSDSEANADGGPHGATDAGADAGAGASVRIAMAIITTAALVEQMQWPSIAMHQTLNMPAIICWPEKGGQTVFFVILSANLFSKLHYWFFSFEIPIWFLTLGGAGWAVGWICNQASRTADGRLETSRNFQLPANKSEA